MFKLFLDLVGGIGNTRQLIFDMFVDMLFQGALELDINVDSFGGTGQIGN